MIYLGLWLLVLGVSVAQAGSMTQQTEGSCSPAIGQTGGNVTVIIYCPRVDPKDLQRLNELLAKKDLDLQEKTREADKWARLYRQAEAIRDSKVTPQAKALLREGKVEEADTLLRRSPAISMAQYQAIQPGMNYQQVVKILGRPGEDAGRSERMVSYTWKNADFSMLVVVFIDGRVHSTAPSGLR